MLMKQTVSLPRDNFFCLYCAPNCTASSTILWFSRLTCQTAGGHIVRMLAAE